jgi:glycine dehydrogenase
MSFESFSTRHLGPRPEEVPAMLKKIGVGSLEELIEKTVPTAIRMRKPLDLPDGISEYEYLQEIRKIGKKNKLFKTYIGQGYYNTIFPAVIQRNILENPSWYTSYTPYQAEISQGRLEALLNFQTMVMELTGMEIANASLLDESTAAAEAMIMMYNLRSREAVREGVNKLFVDKNIFPQNLEVIRTRATPLGIEVITGDYQQADLKEKFFGVIVQYPAADGSVRDYSEFIAQVREQGLMSAVIADIMSLVILTPPGQWGADVVVGSTQRFGIPLGYGGPHAAFFATRDKYKRSIPGRVIGVSIDAQGNHALRMALQTREQHIKRERATSNICTAQALLATMAGMYAVYHGAEGLKRIANQIHHLTSILADALDKMGCSVLTSRFFDTITLTLPKGASLEELRKTALNHEINLLYREDQTVGVSIDETHSPDDIRDLIQVFALSTGKDAAEPDFNQTSSVLEKKHLRTDDFLTPEVFKKFRSETDLMRYIKKLERRDFSLTHSMISLGSCTMKLNAAAELLPLSWPEFGSLHPFVPADQAEGYCQLIDELGKDLCSITGLDAVSFQPNSGAAGEYTGLLTIREYLISKGEGHRNICLIPSSAHGTNPASAVMAGMEVVVVNCDAQGNIDIDDFRQKAVQHREHLAATMITYPSTHGVFETEICELMKIVHDHGGQVYMDGANMNAQVGLTSPGLIGADVCHLNLHKTFAIPHGGGGPGMGPICVATHLADFLPVHPVVKTGGRKGQSVVAAAPWGSASILVISHAYIKMLGGKGLTDATKYAILNANYLSASLKDYYDILYKGASGFSAHEMILDCRKFKHAWNLDITEADIAKRLMDYGFHAPTLSFPVHGTLMVEPTESEPLDELNRFIETMISIYKEIEEVKNGKADPKDNVLKNAPHTAAVVTADEWNHSYSRQKAAYPLKWVADNKFFPSVARVDDAYGDRNLICSCAPIDSYRTELYSFDLIKEP